MNNRDFVMMVDNKQGPIMYAMCDRKCFEEEGNSSLIRKTHCFMYGNGVVVIDDTSAFTRSRQRTKELVGE